ncbi:hypothetical protein SELMODRAFT_430436 [Selaginella moellendorffii]|uniref:Uncharacterized protein n=1 Tax=Selaginella moellendorffii TaxID=88036 RepID=D8T9E6_SELML|nr:hypothetical protein SELMODRAFT_430436 [Selaginella moellendorffii]
MAADSCGIHGKHKVFTPEVLSDPTHRRLMHVNGEEFSKYPVTLIHSLALGYHDSSATQYYIQNLRDDKDVHQVTKIMQKIVQGDNNRRLHLVLDDGLEISAEHAVLFWSIASFGAVVLCGKWQEFLKDLLEEKLYTQ